MTLTGSEIAAARGKHQAHVLRLFVETVIQRERALVAPRIEALQGRVERLERELRELRR